MLKKKDKDSSGLVKKKPISTEVVVVDSSKPVEKKKKKKRTVEGAKNKVAKLKTDLVDEQTLIEQIPENISSQEKQQLDEYLHMFRKLSKLIRKAEKQCFKSGQSRDYYALCTLMSQQREVIADIRSVSDMSGQVATLEANMLQPMVRSIGQNMLDSFYQLRKLLIETTKPNETQFALQKLDEITKEQGKFLQIQYGDAVGKISQIMMG